MVNKQNSTFSHSVFRMSMLVFMLADPAVNKDRLVKICLVHDLAEADVGDITPHAGVSKADKRILEEVSLIRISIPQHCLDHYYKSVYILL